MKSRSDINLQDKAISIIQSLVPSDAKDIVDKTVNQMNTVIREHMRAETGLRLSDDSMRQIIPVRVVEGFIRPLAELIVQYDDPVLWKLISVQSQLQNIEDGLNALLAEWPKIVTWKNAPHCVHGGEESLKQVRDIAAALQEVADARTITDSIKKIEKDILGVYLFSGWNRKPCIEIFWMPIALVASFVQVRIEALTVVVLIHELAHAYTHKGLDIDGNCWSTDDFSNSGISVTEGLAQFYTEVITGKLKSRIPDAYDAYERLLKMQGGPYLAHKEWLKDKPIRRGEAVRFAMLTSRVQGAVSNEQWTSILNRAAYQLRRKKPNAESPV